MNVNVRDFKLRGLLNLSYDMLLSTDELNYKKVRNKYKVVSKD